MSAHKYMLITRSPVFCAMFTGPAKDENSEIKIEDVDKDAFTEMLRCGFIPMLIHKKVQFHLYNKCPELSLLSTMCHLL